MPSNNTPTTRTFKTLSSKPEADSPSEQQGKRRRLNKRNLPWLLILILLVVSGFLFMEYKEAQNKLIDVKTQNAKYEKQLHKLILLPSNESPTIATVKDAEKLRKQLFFKNAQTGDKVFVYNKERKAILYRPSTNMIINVQPVTAPPTSPSEATNP